MVKKLTEGLGVEFGGHGPRARFGGGGY